MEWCVSVRLLEDDVSDKEEQELDTTTAITSTYMGC